MRKSILICLLTMLLLIVAQEDLTLRANSNDFIWEDNGDGSATIIKYIGSDKDVEIPREINRLRVTEIFGGTAIADGAFFGKGLTSVIIPDTVKIIHDNAFAVNNLKSITIPDGVVSIGRFAFQSNQLENVVIPKSVTSINRSFVGNQRNNPQNLTIYGYLSSAAEEYARENNHNFISLDPEFEYIDNGDGTATITRYNGSGGNVEIPSRFGQLRVTIIGESAFENKNIETVKIPNTVTFIDSYAFRNNKLSTLELPDSVEIIRNWVFSYNQLDSLTLPNSVTELGNNTFEYNNITNLNLSESLVTIAPNAFKGNNIKSVRIPTSLRNLMIGAFSDNKLEHVIIPRTVNNIHISAFRGNQSNPSDLIIYGQNGSAAQSIANSEGYTFIDENGIALFGTNGNSNWSNKISTTVDIKGYNPNNLLQYAWSSSTSTPRTGWSNLDNGATVTKTTDSGTYYLHVRGTGYFGKPLHYRSNLFRLDTTPPTNPIISALDDWSSTDQTVTVTSGTDEHSGIAKTEYRIDNGSWSTYSQPFIITRNGETRIDTRSIDNVGNTSEVESKIVKIDKINPSLIITPSTTLVTNEDIELAIKASDKHSGVKSITLPNGEVIFSEEAIYTVKENGVFEFVVEDNAGNSITETIEINNINKYVAFSLPRIE